MKKINCLFLVIVLVALSSLCAQSNGSGVKKNIFRTLSETDSVNKTSVIIHQDSRIEKLVLAKNTVRITAAAGTYSGFRVQVFSSNTQRTGKAEAYKVEKEIREAFPEEEVYVNYISPFWKVRVGDFISRHKAEAFRLMLIDVFPDKKSEAYVVKEKVNYNGTK